MPLDIGMDDAGLVQASQQGDSTAFAELVDRHAAMAYRVAYRVTGNREDAQDVAQESFIAAWQSLTGFKGDAQFSTWLYRIVTRRALNRATRGRVHPDTQTATTASWATDPGEIVQHGHAVAAVTRAVSALPGSQRDAVVMHHFDGLSYAQVAAATASTVPAVRSHLHRARRRLAGDLSVWR